MECLKTIFGIGNYRFTIPQHGQNNGRECMTNKTTHTLTGFILVLICVIAANASDKRAIHTLYNNRNFIMVALDSSNWKQKTIFESYLKKPVAEWSRDANLLIEIVNTGIRERCVSSETGKNRFCNNDTMMNIMLSYLQDTTSEKNQTSLFALEFLTQSAAYPVVRRYSPALKFALNNLHTNEITNGVDLLKMRLFLMCDYTEQEKMAILDRKTFLSQASIEAKKKVFKRAEMPEKITWQDSEYPQIIAQYPLPLEFQARLGDTAALKKLIVEYENIRNYDRITQYSPNVGWTTYFDSREKYRRKSELVGKLLFAGTDGIRVLIKKFNEPMYYDNSPYPWREKTDKMTDSMFLTIKCYQEAIRWPILVGLSRYHPTETFFDEIFSIAEKRYPFADTGPGKTYDDTLCVLINKFKQWAMATYGVKPIDIEPATIYLKRKCLAAPELAEQRGDGMPADSKNGQDVDQQIQTLKMQIEEAEREKRVDDARTKAEQE
jgi:hypothetical protein